MSGDFIKIKSMDGELKASHKLRDYGLTVSTREVVLQKPHVNYHFKLEDIVSIVPVQDAGEERLPFVNQRSFRKEITHLTHGGRHYKMYIKEALCHNRSGIFRLGEVLLIMPVVGELLDAIAEHGGLHVVRTG